MPNIFEFFSDPSFSSPTEAWWMYLPGGWKNDTLSTSTQGLQKDGPDTNAEQGMMTSSDDDLPW